MIKSLRYLVLFLIFLLFASCTNTFNGRNDLFTVHGKCIVSEEDSSINVSRNISRSAFPSLPAAEDIFYSVQAFNKSGVASKYTSVGNSSAGYSIDLPKGSWSLKLNGYLYEKSASIPTFDELELKGKLVFEGSVSAFEVADKDISLPDTIVLPVKAGKGTVKLPIQLESTSYVKKVVVRWDNTKAQTLTFSEGNKDYFTMNDADVGNGSYSISIDYLDGNGAVITTLDETVVVYGNRITEYWTSSENSAFISAGILKVPDSLFKTKTTYYVDDKGSSNGSGSYAAPFKYISDAMSVITSKGLSEATIIIKESAVSSSSITLPKDLALTIKSYGAEASISSYLKSGAGLFVLEESASLKLDGIKLLGEDNTAVSKSETRFVCLNSGSKFTAENCLFSGNMINSSGAAIYGNGSVSITIKQSQFVNNSSASKGGAVYLDNGAKAIFEDVNFKDNYAEVNGGAVYVGNGKSINHSQVTVKGNVTSESNKSSATDGYDNIYLESGILIYTETLLEGSSIGIRTQSAAYPITITSGYGLNNTLEGSVVDATKFFKSDIGCDVFLTGTNEVYITQGGPVSGGSEDHLGDSVVFAVDTSILTGSVNQTLKVTAYKNSVVTGNEIACDDWNLSITTASGVSTNATMITTADGSKNSSISITDSNWPSGSYILWVSAVCDGKLYTDSFTLTK